MTTTKTYAHVNGEVLETEEGLFIPFSNDGKQVIEGGCQTLQAAFHVLENQSDDPDKDKNYDTSRRKAAC